MTILSAKKTNGRIYTPDFIVSNILDLCDYRGTKILKKNIIDNSCGDGAFLVEVVRRYCEAAHNAGFSVAELAVDLLTFVHGIEIDQNECEKCRANVSRVAAAYGVTGVNWDIVCSDTLTVENYNGKMDFVVGNPPYVRVHNLLDSYNSVKGFSFAQNGMTDLYIVFYEIGLKMLNSTGVLGYISPSSFFNSLAASTMREYVALNRNIKTVVDLKHFQPFEATTYTTIIILTNQRNYFVDYYEYDQGKRAPFAVSRLNYEDFAMNGSFVFGKKRILNGLQEIITRTTEMPITVKNGFATLCDEFFIGEWLFSDYTIPIIKASTGRVAKCIFPYDKFGKLIPYDVLTKDRMLKEHYDRYADMLKNRSLENSDNWHGFGRSQGINDVNKNKYAINTLIRNVGDIKLKSCEQGTGVYSGLYILTDLEINELKSVLFTEEFINYIAMLGKYKSGGYYTYSSKDLARYLNYKLSGKAKRYEQLAVS